LHISLSNWISFISWNHRVILFQRMRITDSNHIFIGQSFEENPWLCRLHITLSNWTSFISKDHF
jgi:hypothetical protein